MLNHNVAQLLAKRAADSGWYSKPAYYSPNVVTHGEVHEGGARLGEVLRARGLSKGDRVLLCLPDSPELVQVLLACLARGIFTFLVNPELHPEDHAFVERDTEPRLIVTSSTLRDRFQISSGVEVGELLADATRVEPGECEPVSGDAPAYATYTSGTTGPPRAAIHRHADPLIFTQAMCHHALHMIPQDIGLSSARMYFGYGLGNSVWCPLATGSSAIINHLPVNPEVAAEQCGQLKASVLYGVPTFFARVVETCSADSFRSLRCLVSAGEILTASLAEELMEFFGGIPILDGIGSSEVGHIFVSNTVDEWRLGTLGKALHPYEVRVVAADGTTTSPGVEGDLWVRGPSITPGYWNRPDHLPAQDGWLETSDRVCIDRDGWVTYRCRADDIENVGGFNINPREIELLLTGSDLIEEAAVIGLRESTGASALQAFLVPKSNVLIDQATIQHIHRQLLLNLAPFKVPHRFAIVDRLPRTATGKLLRSALRAEAPTMPIWNLLHTADETDPEGQIDLHQVSDTSSGSERMPEATLRDRFAVLQKERYHLALATVCAEASKILERPDHEWINPDRAFSELGIDSQMIVELRNRLAKATGLRLSDKVMWAYGSPSELAQYIEVELAGRSNQNELPTTATIGAEPVANAGMGRRHPDGHLAPGSTASAKPILALQRRSGSGGRGGEIQVTTSDAPTQTLPAEGEVGLVDIGSLTLESGTVIDDVCIAVQRWGELSPARDNVVVVLHGMTRDSHITGPAGPGHPTRGWWHGMAGPGAPIDTDRWCAVATNVLGGCRGSTGPSSLACDGKPWGSRFPLISVRDQVEADVAALAALGITEVAAVIGGSLGGARALEWIVSHPDRVGAGLVMAVGARATGDAIGTQSTQIAAIKADPNWQGGDYHDTGRTPDAGLQLARRIACLTFRGEVELDIRFANNAQGEEDPIVGGRYAVESYLEQEGSRLVSRFDAGSYVVICEAMNRHDVGRGRGGVAAALRGCPVPVVVGGITSDRIFPLRLQEELADLLPGCSELQVLDSIYGHDAFQVESEAAGEWVRQTLELAAAGHLC
jgi:4-hydroxybenzoate adenylyltransferase